MLLSGLAICFLALASATVYAANGSLLALIVSAVLLVIGAGLAIPAAVATEKEEEK